MPKKVKEVCDMASYAQQRFHVHLYASAPPPPALSLKNKIKKADPMEKFHDFTEKNII